MSHHSKDPTLPALVQLILPIDLFQIDHRYNEIGKEKHKSPMELRRRYAQNGKRIFIHLNNTAHHTGIFVKMAVPIRVREHDVRSAVSAMLIGRMKQTAKIRLKAQSVEVIPAHQHDPGF